MAKVDSRGFVDDGSDDLEVAGSLSVAGTATLAAIAPTAGEFSGNVGVTGSLGVLGATTLASAQVTGNAQLTGSVLLKINATNQITANSDDLSYTTVAVGGKCIVPVSASCLSASGGFNTSGGVNGQSCYFINVGSKPVIMLGYADAASITIDASTAAHALYYNAAWYHMSGTL